jgi:hypothetical protein
MLDFYPIHVPESGTPGQCLATFSTTITALAIELGTYFDLQMQTRIGPSWFAELKAYRERHDSKYHLYKSIYDFSWVVNEPFQNVDSPIRDLLPKNEYQFYPAMKNLLAARNRWYHDFNPHNMTELRKALDLAKYISEKCGLELNEDLIPVIKRVNEITAGTYKSPVGVSPQKQEIVDIKPKPLRQSAVGAAWLGPVGQRKIQFSKAGSLIDLGKGENVTAEFTNDKAARYLSLWKVLGIDWLWVDELGSIAANVHGSLRMVGYWGQGNGEQEQDPFAKFLLTNTYSFASDVFYERENSLSLDDSDIGDITRSTIARAHTMLQEGEILRVTWDGDLISFTDQGPEYIGEVESKDWFPGHFFIATE